MTQLPIEIPSHNVELISWFQPQFEAVFVLLHPFFRVSPDLYEQFTHSDVVPTRQEWSTLAHPTSWSDVASGVGFPDRGVLHTTLLQRSKAIRSLDADAVEQLDTYLEQQHLLEPTNGSFDELLLDSMLDACAQNGQMTVFLASEFDPNAREYDIGTVRSNPDARLGQVQPVLWTRDQSVLLCVHWDCYYSCIAGPADTLRDWARRYQWEGFFAAPGTCIFWENDPDAR